MGAFLLNIFEVKELSLAHLHLQQVQEEANKGTLEAMITLSRLYGNKEDEKLFNMKLSARWTHFAESLYPDNEIIADCLYHLHFSSLGNAVVMPGIPFVFQLANYPARLTVWCKVYPENC